jgi:hypothetical protein
MTGDLTGDMAGDVAGDSADTGGRHARGWSGRSFRTGFLFGCLVTVPTVFLALMSNVSERLLPVLVPGSVLLRPLSSTMAEWPGLVNVGLTVLVNGVVFGLAGTAVAAVVALARRR